MNYIRLHVIPHEDKSQCMFEFRHVCHHCLFSGLSWEQIDFLFLQISLIKHVECTIVFHKPAALALWNSLESQIRKHWPLLEDR